MIGKKQKTDEKQIITIFPQEWLFSPKKGIRTFKNDFCQQIDQDRVLKYIEEFRTAADWLETSVQEYSAEMTR